MGIQVKARSGGARSFSSLYWGWIRDIASKEGLTLPQSGSATDVISGRQATELAAVLRSRADKIRKGTSPRDAKEYVRQIDGSLFPSSEGESNDDSRVDFDDPESMDETAAFFSSSDGVTLTY